MEPLGSPRVGREPAVTDDVLSDVAQLAVAVLAAAPQVGEGLVLVDVLVAHHDAHGHADSTVADQCGPQLGEIVSVRRAPISFSHVSNEYRVSAEKFAAMTVRPMPNNECCAQPHLVWYQPLSPLASRKVGYTDSASYTAGKISDPWQRAGENSAFYGAFSW